MKRTHQYLLVGSFVAVALSLSACDEGSSSRRPVRVAQHAKNGNGRNADPKAGTKGTGTQSTTSSTVCATDATTGKRAGTTPADQCFNALCTEKTNLSKIASDGEKGTTEQQDYYKKSLLPLLTTKIQARQKNLQARLDHYNAEEKNFDSAKTTLNDFQLKAIKGVLLTRNDSHISADISKSAIEALQASDFAKAYATFTTNKGNSYLQAMQKGVSIEEAIAAEVSYMTATKDKLNKALNAEIIGQNRLLEKAAKKTPLSNSEIEALSRDSHNIHMLDFFVFGAGADLLSKATVANSDLLTYETNFKNKLQTKVKTQNTDMTDCEKQAYRLMNLSPQKTELESFATLADKVRKESIGLLTQQDPAYDKISNATISYPKNAEDAMSEWTDSLKQASADDEYTKFDDAALLTAAVIYSPAQTKDASKDTQKEAGFCDDVAKIDVSEKALDTDPSITLSWLAIKKPELGASILARAFGRIANQSSNSFANDLTCLKDKASDATATEDFADWFSAKVSVALSKNQQITISNIGCFLSASDATLSLKSTDDKTSSHLFRALQIAEVSGTTVPDSCASLAKSENSKAGDVCR